MYQMNRRTFMATAALGATACVLARAAAEGAKTPAIRVGSCSVGGFDRAKLAGLDGIELRAGDPADRLQIADPATIAKHKADMQASGLVVSSVMMSLFNSNPLASDPRGPAWLDQCIDGAAAVGAQVILVAFFGKGSLKDGQGLKKADADVVVQRLKDAAPKAKEKGVILGIENTISAQDNLAILDRIGSDAVKIYYDIFNLTGQGYDAPAEIRLLKDRIAIFHFKNGGDYLETGKVKFEPSVAAIQEIGYKGWIVLETSNPSKDAVADTRRNADYVRKLFGVTA